MKKIITLFCFLATTTLFSAQQTHTVVKGDNPYRISKSYGISLEEIYKLNPEIRNNPLSLGQVIKLRKSVELGQIIIQPKQTVYGITKQYHISEKELRKLNPNLENHMKIGDNVVLPLDKIKKYAKGQEFKLIKESSNDAEPNQSMEPATPVETTYNVSHVSKDNYMMYKVKEDDTLFGIVNSFNVTVDDLIELNPKLSNGLRSGMELKVKKSPKSYSKTNAGILNVSIVLPFGYHDNSSKYRKMSMSFLKGVQYALERKAAKGKRIKAKIIDGGTGRNFQDALKKIDKQHTDLIIGPLFKASLIEVLDYVKEERIPVVAPFANSEDLYGYSNLVMTTPDDQSYASGIAQEVIKGNNGQKIHIISDNEYGTYIKNEVAKALPEASIEIVKSASDVVLEQNMMTGNRTPATFVLATSDKKEGTIFANKLLEVAKETQGAKAYSMYYVKGFEKKKNIEGFKKVNLVYLMDRKINKEGRFEKEILKGYKAKYCESIADDKYAIVGFDIVNDMLMRENDKAELKKQIGRKQSQLATRFQFVEAKKGGAYINVEYQVVRLKTGQN